MSLKKAFYQCFPRLELDQLDAMRRMSGDDRKTGVWRGGHGGALAIGLTSWL